MFRRLSCYISESFSLLRAFFFIFSGSRKKLNFLTVFLDNNFFPAFYNFFFSWLDRLRRNLYWIIGLILCLLISEKIVCVFVF